MAKILVADGNAAVRGSLEARLAGLGFEVACAISAEECLGVLESGGIDLAVLDLSFSHTSGEPLLRHIRSGASASSQVPVIGTLSNIRRELLAQAWEHQAFAVLAKPFSFALLVRKIEALLAPPRRSAALDPASVRILLSAASHVFEKTAGLSLVPGRPYVKNDSQQHNAFSAIIRFCHRNFGGFMAVNLDEGLLHKVLVGMLGAENASDEVEALKDCCGELTNQILGRAKHIFLSEKGLDFEMGVPKVLHGVSHLVQFPSQSPVLVVPFECSPHRIFVEFCTDETTENLENDKPMEPAAKEGELILF